MLRKTREKLYPKVLDDCRGSRDCVLDLCGMVSVLIKFCRIGRGLLACAVRFRRALKISLKVLEGDLTGGISMDNLVKSIE